MKKCKNGSLAATGDGRGGRESSRKRFHYSFLQNGSWLGLLPTSQRIPKQKFNKNNKKNDGAELGLKPVKDTYNDVDDYLATFEPLLFEEVKAQIIQKKDDEEGFSFSLLLF
ncbi:hypothetical protein Q3G72_011063 [Acer saccharum]|nr:hypothetical protein Q3G72_011063 [Acer saccharum]